EVTLYVDGTTAGSAIIVSFADDTKNSLQFGAANGSLGFNGRLDDIQIYERPLTANHAAFLFANPGEVVGANQGSGGLDTRTSFVITEIQTGAEGNVRVNFVSEPGKTYAAEFSTDLVNWAITVDDITAQSTVTVVRQARPAGHAGYIRIREKE
ncbi:MAG: hypothetical protein ACI957_005963, partial [Verrucomicrobiales bacterium]